jgi:hypothetical protein
VNRIPEGESCPTCLRRSERYNGWTNYETWVVKLWMDNDEDSCRSWREEAERALGDARDGAISLHYGSQTHAERAACHLADILHEKLVNAHGVTGVCVDLLSSAMSAVNWYEIAENILDELPAEEPAQ